MGRKSAAGNKQQQQQNGNNNKQSNNNKKNQKSSSESKVPPPAVVEEQSFTEEQLKIHRENVVKLTKDLAATDEGFRTRATERFPTFLKETKFIKLDLDTNFIDFRKLWKGALFGFWLCDGDFKQHEMAQLLAECIHKVKGSEQSPWELPIAFLRAFFDELFDTWPRLDKHRMDKYLMLVRKVMQQSFVFLNKTAHYKKEAVEEFIEFILQDGVFNHEERKLLASLQIHIAELFFLELIQYGGPQVEDDADYHLNEDSLMQFIQFFIKDFASTENHSIKKTYSEEMFDLLAQYQSTQGGEEGEEQEEEENGEENGDEMEDDEDSDDDDLPVDEFGNVRDIKKDRPLPINNNSIVKEFEKYKTGYPNSDICTQYYEKFKNRIITMDDLYSELEEVETVVSQKEKARNEKKQARKEKKQQQELKETPQKKEQEGKKQKKEQKSTTTTTTTTKAATLEQKKVPAEKQKQQQQKLLKEQEEKKAAAAAKLEQEAVEEKKRSTQSLLNKVKSVKKLIQDTKKGTQTTTNGSSSTSTSKVVAAPVSSEKPEKKVIIDLEKNQVKTFNKKDIVPSLPVDLTFSPTKGLLKTRQDTKKRSSNSLDSIPQKSSKKRK